VPYVEQTVMVPGEWVWIRYAKYRLIAQVIDPGPLEREGNLLALAPPVGKPCPPKLLTKVNIPGLGLRDVESYWIKKAHPLEVLAMEAES